MRFAATIAGFLVVGLGACATSGQGNGVVVAGGPSGPFVSQKLAITDRNANGFTVEIQLELDNPGPGTILVHSAAFEVALSGKTVAKGDLLIDQTAEAGERQGVVIPVKVKLGDQANELGAGEVNVRTTGTLTVTRRGEQDLPFSVMLDVPGDSLLAR